MVVSFQLLLALVLSREKAMPWWPFSLIATETLCFVILILLLKKENKPFRSIQLLPFETSLPLGKISYFLNKKPSKNNITNFIKDAVLFIVLLLILGVPAIMLNGFINQNIPILRDTKIIGILPGWAPWLMIVLLPMAQALIEFPWFYGYLYPRLETYFEKNSGKRRIIASIIALSICLAFFIIQAALVPLILNPYYTLWRAISFVPLLLVIGIIIRLVPRFMIGANILHAVLAINVVLQYWKI